MTRVKICGITRAEDAQLAVDLGAWAVGFVCWPGSPRYVDTSRIRSIANSLPPEVLKVGVFVDQPIGHVRLVAEAAGLTTIQLHGRESPTLARGLDQPAIKAVPVRADFNAADLDAIPKDVTVLLDAFDPLRHGGTGRAIDWSLAAGAATRRPIILAGGLHAGNVAEAITVVRPYAVDLSSGVESSPGLKDRVKLRDLFEAITHV